MGIETQKFYDLGFNIRYIADFCISVSLCDFTGYFSRAMPFAFKVKNEPTMISHDRMWPQDVMNHIEILKIGRMGYKMIESEEFKVLLNKTLSKQIIKAAGNIAKFKMNLITQEIKKHDHVRIRRKQR